MYIYGFALTSLRLYVCMYVYIYVMSTGLEDRSAQDFDFLFSHLSAGCGPEAAHTERRGRRVHLRQGHQVRLPGGGMVMVMYVCIICTVCMYVYINSIFTWSCG